jgi:hypothetical protein
VLEAITATPSLFRFETVLVEKSAAATAPFIPENAPLWQASSTATVSVLGKDKSERRSESSDSSPPSRLSARAWAWPE